MDSEFLTLRGLIGAKLLCYMQEGGGAMYEVYSETWNLVSESASSPEPKKPRENLD
jgi:hypothetical protein